MELPKKIPTLAAILALFFTIGVISVGIQKITSFSTTAAPQLEPKNVQMTNISDTSFTVLWQTDEPSTGLLNLSQKTINSTAYDDRDVTGKMNKYTTHSVSIKNLSPGTTYEGFIVSNGKKYPTTGKPYTFHTGASLSGNTVSFDPAYGIIKKFDGRSAEGALVTLVLGDSQMLSTLVRSTGSWMIPLNTLRSKDLSSYIQPSTENPMTGTLSIMLDTQKSEALVDSKNLSPVPDITIGQTYDFRNYQVKNKSKTTIADAKKQLPTPSTVPAVLGDQTVKTSTSTATTSAGAVTITNPVNNSSIVSTKPLIQGTGIPGKTITITLGITKPSTGKTTVGKNGLWQYTPTVALSQGKQSVTITTVDNKNKAIALTNNFTVLKSGSQVLGDATPSATLIPTPTEEATIAAEPLPESGSTLPTVLLILVGVGFVVGGTLFFIL